MFLVFMLAALAVGALQNIKQTYFYKKNSHYIRGFQKVPNIGYLCEEIGCHVSKYNKSVPLSGNKIAFYHMFYVGVQNRNSFLNIALFSYVCV